VKVFLCMHVVWRVSSVRVSLVDDRSLSSSALVCDLLSEQLKSSFRKAHCQEGHLGHKGVRDRDALLGA